MDVKIRHNLIKIEDRVSDRFVILITNYRWLFFLEETNIAICRGKNKNIRTDVLLYFFLLFRKSSATGL